MNTKPTTEERRAPDDAFEHCFTVFTPTYNRASTLHRVYDSLRAQTCCDFEWLIVDDGSTDETDRLVRDWQEEADFPIRYIHKENGGKHTAFNRGVLEARGALFLTLDSDDACVPEALERLLAHWNNIPAEERDRFSAVTGLCRDQDGNLVGRPLPASPLDSNSLEMTYRFRYANEKWGFQRTDVLRQYPFPEDARGSYVPESLVWHQIARHYQTRYVNDALRIYWTEGASLLRGVKASHNAAARRVYYLHVLNNEMDWFRFAPVRFLKTAIQYVRMSLHAGIGLGRQVGEVRGIAAHLLHLVAILPGSFLHARDGRSKAHQAGASAPCQ